jgi:predicted nucleic acid-binding protein
VIRYTLDLDDNSIDKKNVLKKIYVKLFLDELKKENIEVFTLEAKSIHMKHVFVMLHCPMERLLVEAEKTKLEMQLKNVFI